MAVTKYTYSVATDITAGIANIDSLQTDIEATDIITVLDHIDLVGDVLDVYFKAAISAGDETTLDAAVLAHTGTAPPETAQVISAFADPAGRSAAFEGTHQSNCPTSPAATTMNYTIPTGGRWFTGLEYEARSPNVGDKINLEIHHPTEGLLNTFGKSWNVMTQPRKYDVYGIWLAAGLIIRVIYTNAGGSAVEFSMNAFLHSDSNPPS